MIRVVDDRDGAAVLATASSPRWVLPALAGVGGLAAFLYLWNLTVSGYGNTYYAMAAQAASQSWSAWLFGALDAGSFITLDKPPLANWILGLSVRAFGLSPASVLLPQALAGVATVLILFAAVRRSFGPAEGIVAALVAALTPAAVLIFRYDNPDAVLVLLLVLAAYALVRSLEAGAWRWVLLAAALVGAGFLAKYLQAWMVLPAFALTYLAAAPGGLGRRLAQLAAAAATVLVTSAWWVVLVDAIPAAARPYVGGSQTNSALDLLLGYDGLGRIFGEGGPAFGGGGGGSPFGGEPGPFRLFNEQFDGQIAWLLPFAFIALGAGLWLARAAPRTDRRGAGHLLWGGWLLTHALVLSFMSGIVHPYYAVALAPAIGALVGAGVVDLWAWRSRSISGGVLLGTAVAATALVAAALLARTPDFVPWLGPVVAVGGAVLAVALALPAGTLPARPAAAALGLAVVVVLAGPASYAAATMDRALGGGDPQVGPANAAADELGGRRNAASLVPGIIGGIPGILRGAPPGGPVGPGGALRPAGFPGGPPAIGGAGAAGDVLGADILGYLVANRGGATWLLAVTSANVAGPIQLATGIPVMAMGGFSGSDPAPTLEQLQGYVRSGALRFVMAGTERGGFGGPPGAVGDGRAAGSGAVSGWVMQACAPVRIGGPGGQVVAGLYDCAGAAT